MGKIRARPFGANQPCVKFGIPLSIGKLKVTNARLFAESKTIDDEVLEGAIEKHGGMEGFGELEAASGEDL